MLSDRQKEFDKIKWLDSEEKGYDTCGSYEFCAKCDKKVENPCDNAFNSKKKRKKLKKIG